MNNKILKIIEFIFIAIVIIVLLIAFSSSYASFNIDNLTFVIAIAIDKGTSSNTIQVSFQFVKPASLSETGSSDNEATVINTVETSSINTAINLMDSYMGKETNLSHCKLIVFSEEIAKDGLSNMIYTLANDIQIRPSTNIIISKTTAKHYLESSNPSIESLPSAYYEIFPNSGQYTGYTANITIGDFLNGLACDAIEPCAILGGTIDENIDNLSKYSSDNPLNSGDIKSNEISISAERGAENIGLAVFKCDKLVGELNAIETVCFSLINNQIDGFLLTIRDPNNENEYIDIYLYPDKNTKKKAKIINGTPYITIECKFDGRIYSMKNNSNYINGNILKDISDSVSNYMNLQMKNYLYKTSKKFCADINGLGKSSFSNFLTFKELENYKWSENYKDSVFSVNCKVNVKSGFLLVET